MTNISRWNFIAVLTMSVCFALSACGGAGSKPATEGIPALQKKPKAEMPLRS